MRKHCGAWRRLRWRCRLRSPRVSPASAQSLTDRFKGLFGGKSDEPASAAAAAPASRRPSRVDLPAGHDPRRRLDLCGRRARQAGGRQRRALPGHDHQDGARMHQDGGEITARIGIQGRVIAGPAGAPATVEVPLRVAVVQGGVGEKVIATKAYRTTVEMSRGRQRAVHLRRRGSGLSGAVGARSPTTTSSMSASIRRRCRREPKPAKKKK